MRARVREGEEANRTRCCVSEQILRQPPNQSLIRFLYRLDYLVSVFGMSVDEARKQLQSPSRT